MSYLNAAQLVAYVYEEYIPSVLQYTCSDSSNVIGTSRFLYTIRIVHKCRLFSLFLAL